MVDYDPHQWRQHLLDVHGSMLNEIWPRLLVLTIWSVAVLGFHLGVRPVAFSPTAHSLVGTALGLLLVFRTNASYDRFWEGRKLWGGIVNECRNLARQSASWLPDHPQLRNQLIIWVGIYPYAVMAKLRGTPLVAPGLEEVGDPAAVVNSSHPPMAISVLLTRAIGEVRKKNAISDLQQVAMDQNIQQLVDYLGACERIHKTPLPFAYMVHLRRALILYCMTLPFALMEAFGSWSVLATGLITYIFLGIEEIGVEIEDPFGLDANDLPLERICDTIRKNVVALND